MRPERALEVEVAGEVLWLLPERAVFWPRRHTLLVADAHLGKAAAFRNGGIPVPSGTTADNLERLSLAVADCGARCVVFLGDLVHSAAAKRAAARDFAQWRARHAALDVLLVGGNHDRHAGALPHDWGVEPVAAPFRVDGFALCHAPARVPGLYGLAGHVHPCVRLRGRGRERLRLPCFWFNPSFAVLPAFGAFTGTADVEPGAGDRVFVVAGEVIVAASGAGAGGHAAPPGPRSEAPNFRGGELP